MIKQLKFKDYSWTTKIIVDEVFIVASVYDEDEIEYMVAWHAPRDVIPGRAINGGVNFSHVDKDIYGVYSYDNDQVNYEIINLKEFLANVSRDC